MSISVGEQVAHCEDFIHILPDFWDSNHGSRYCNFHSYGGMIHELLMNICLDIYTYTYNIHIYIYKYIHIYTSWCQLQISGLNYIRDVHGFHRNFLGNSEINGPFENGPNFRGKFWGFPLLFATFSCWFPHLWIFHGHGNTRGFGCIASSLLHQQGLGKLVKGVMLSKTNQRRNYPLQNEDISRKQKWKTKVKR